MRNKVVPQVGLRELRHDTRGVIDRVRLGESVDVTDRGAPVARIVPVATPPDPSPFDRLVAADLARRAVRRGPLRPPIHVDGVSLGQALEEMRNEERY